MSVDTDPSTVDCHPFWWEGISRHGHCGNNAHVSWPSLHSVRSTSTTRHTTVHGVSPMRHAHAALHYGGSITHCYATCAPRVRTARISSGVKPDRHPQPMTLAHTPHATTITVGAWGAREGFRGVSRRQHNCYGAWDSNVIPHVWIRLIRPVSWTAMRRLRFTALFLPGYYDLGSMAIVL